jgi:hypothetical protein
MYRISRDNRGTILTCLACTHTERVQDFDGNLGNRRTLAAREMLKHVRAEHSGESHARAMAMVMERQDAPR